MESVPDSGSPVFQARAYWMRLNDYVTMPFYQFYF